MTVMLGPPLLAEVWTPGEFVPPNAVLDRSGWRPDVRPLGVVRARSVEDVRATLRWANATGTPVVPRGGGSGLAGGAVPTDGAVVLDVSRLDRILELSTGDRLARVEPGVVTADLDRAAGAVGLRYAPDPASAAISTVGGNIATNAGGLRCAKYGVTREAVLGLDVVLADGRLISTGGRTVKRVTGYDLTSLFVGSEGTLGVVVGATLKLRPMPSATAVLGSSFPDVAAAAAAVAALGTLDVEPSMTELLAPETVAVLADLHESLVRGGAYLLVQTDGSAALTDAQAVGELLAAHGGTVTMAASDAEGERLVDIRRGVLPALERRGRVMIEDVAVPRSRLAAMFDRAASIAAEHRVAVHAFAHAGDGTVHPILVLDDAPDARERGTAAADDLFAAALELGGTITGEHGVGRLKREWMRRELGADVLEIQQRIKDALDPRGILNPEKA